MLLWTQLGSWCVSSVGCLLLCLVVAFLWNWVYLWIFNLFVTGGVSFKFFAFCWYEPCWGFNVLVQMDVCYYVCLLICYNFESFKVWILCWTSVSCALCRGVYGRESLIGLVVFALEDKLRRSLRLKLKQLDVFGIRI